MPKKLEAPTDAEISELMERCSDLCSDAERMTGRLVRSMSSVKEAIDLSRRASRLASAASDLAHALLHGAAIEADRAKIEATMRARTRGEE